MDKVLLKNWLLPSKSFYERACKCILIASFLWPLQSFSQVANFVKNGGFEDKYNCNYPAELNKAIGWNIVGTDTSKFGGFLHAINCYSNAPNTGSGFQYPRSGDTYYELQAFCTNPCAYNGSRGSPKNRLKANLKANATYCVKMYVSLKNGSPDAISDLAIYLADGSIDTIKYCYTPLIYLNPQVKNPANNIIADTLNWVLVGGTFVATGNEKYLTLGNFDTDAATTKSVIVPNSTSIGSVYFVDDVSCIDIDLPAYACANSYTYNVPGDSVFLGRQPDVGIDEDCMWYKLPNMTTAIDTVAGFWAKPIMTTSYVVRQEICGNVKWDTVVVTISSVGIQNLEFKIQNLQLYPVPAQDELKIQWSLDGLEKEFTKAEVLNGLGQVVNEVDLNYSNKNATVNVKDLVDGVYAIRVIGVNSECISRRFVKK